MGFFRKKPVVIEARLFDGSLQSALELREWVGNAGHIQEGEILTLTIHTLEGDHRADPGDWVIRGIKGEHYPCKPDIFEKTYEPYNPIVSAEGPGLVLTPPKI